MLKAAVKIEIGFGIEFCADGTTRVQGFDHYIETIKGKAAELFGGFTLFTTTGGWRDPDTGFVVMEEGRCLVVYTDDCCRLDARVLVLAELIKSLLNQKAVFICKNHVQTDCV